LGGELPNTKSGDWGAREPVDDQYYIARVALLRVSRISVVGSPNARKGTQDHGPISPYRENIYVL